MKPKIRFLTDELIQKIISEARDVLCTLGVDIHNKTILQMLSDHGCQVDMDKYHAVLTGRIIDQALKTVPESFKLYDDTGDQTHDYSGDHV